MRSRSAEWEIATDQNFQSLALAKVVHDRTSLRLSAGVLDPMHSYWIRTRLRDARGALSDWSTPVAFTTAAAAPGDADGNGVEDASQVYGFADSNGDGINDADQGICDLLDAAGGHVVGIESDLGHVRCFRSVSAGEAPSLPSAGMEFPYGLFSFRIDGLRVDPVNPASVTIRVHLPARPAGSVKWYKLDPATGSLSEFAGNVTFERQYRPRGTRGRRRRGLRWRGQWRHRGPERPADHPVLRWYRRRGQFQRRRQHRPPAAGPHGRCRRAAPPARGRAESSIGAQQLQNFLSTPLEQRGVAAGLDVQPDYRFRVRHAQVEAPGIELEAEAVGIV